MKKQKTSKETKTTLLIALLPVLILLVVAFVLYDQNRRQAVESRIRENTIALPAPIPQSAAPMYTDEEIHKFWDLHLNHLIIEQVLDEKYSIPEVNARVHTLLKESARRYGVTYRVEAVSAFNKDSGEIIAGSYVKEGQPVLSFIVPKIMMDYGQFQTFRPLQWKEKFECDMVMSTLHELDHLALGEAGLPSDTTQDLVAHEEKVWAQTCEWGISIFVAQGRPLSDGKLAWWNDWVSCGRRENACWHAAVSRVYAPIGNSRKR